MDQQQQRQHLTQYQQFEGIWRAIDENNLRKLENHRDLHNDINEKQQGVTPLHLVRPPRSIAPCQIDEQNLYPHNY